MDHICIYSTSHIVHDDTMKLFMQPPRGEGDSPRIGRMTYACSYQEESRSACVPGVAIKNEPLNNCQ